MIENMLVGTFKHYYSIGDVHYCDTYDMVNAIKEGQSISSYLNGISDRLSSRVGQYHGKQHD